MFVGSCLITLKENPRVYPWIKIFSTDCPLKITGRGRGGQCKKFVTSLVCLLHPAESEKLKLLLDGDYDLFVIADMSKIKKYIN